MKNKFMTKGYKTYKKYYKNNLKYKLYIYIIYII